MTMARGGLYSHLKDGETPWNVKVKTARFIWKSDHVHLPNKEQVILDWLCLSLAGKRRVPASEADPVWQCLHDVLHTRRCHATSSRGQALLLKPVLYQQLLEELQCDLRGDGRTCSTLDVIIGCWHSIVMSSTIGYTVTSKFEQMVQLLSLALQVGLKHYVSRATPLPDTWQQLITVTANKCASLRPKANAQTVVQNVSSKLLIPVATILHQSSADTSSCGHSRLTKPLTDLLFAALFSKDMFKYYDLYLKVVMGHAGGSSQIPKFIELVFSEIKQQLSSKEEPRSMETFLPQFYLSFLDIYKPGENVISFHLLTHLMSLLGISPSGDSSSSLPPTRCLNTCWKLLEVALAQNVYKPAVDLSHDGKHLTWLQHLTDWLLAHTDRSAAWFGCLHLLMKLSYSTIEPKLTQVLKAAWLNIPMVEEEASVAQSDFLCDLVQIYAKLHQIPKLISKILGSLNDCDHHIDWSAPQLCDRLSHHFTQLPQSMCIDVWKLLVNHLSSHCVPQIQQGNAVHETEAVCSLMSLFLMNIRVADYSVTHMTASLVHDLMGRTRANVLQPLLQCMLDNKSAGMPAILKLMWSWGELHLVLSCYMDYKPADAFAQITTPVAANDLSFLHPYVSMNVANKLHMMVSSKKDVGLTHQWEQLLLQKIRAILVFCDLKYETESALRSSVQNCVTSWFDLLPEQDSVHLQAYWDGQTDSLNASSYVVATWHLMCKFLPLLAPWCSDKQLQHTVRYALWTLNGAAPPSRVGFVTLHDISGEMLQMPEFKESVALQKALVTTFLQLCGDCLMTKRTPKKQKTGSMLSGSKLLMSLSEMSKTDKVMSVESVNYDQNCVLSGGHCLQMVRVVSAHIRALSWNSDEIDDIREDVEMLFSIEINSGISEEQAAMLLSYLKVMEAQPVEYFTNENHIRTFLGVSVILSHIACGDSASSTLLSQTCLHLLVLLLDGAAATRIYSVVNSAELCDWLMKQACSFTKQDAGTKKQYQDVLFSLLFMALKSNQDLSSLAHFINKVIANLKEAEDSVPDFQPGFHIHLHTGVIILQALSMMLCRSSLKQEVKEVCNKYFGNISEVVMNVIQALFLQPADWLLKSGFLDMMIDGVTVMLDFIQKNQEASFNKNILLNLQDASRMTLTVLKSSQVSECQRLALSFIQKACVTHNALKDLYPKMFLEKAWNQLILLLKTLEENSPKHQQKTSALILSEKIDSGRAPEVKGDEDDEVNFLDTDLLAPHSSHLSKQGHTLKQEVEECLACVTSSADLDSFRKFIDRLVENVDIHNFETQTTTVTVSLGTWNRLLTESMDDEKMKIIRLASQNLILRLNELDTAVASYESVSCDVADCLDTMLSTLTTMLTFGPSLLSEQCVPLCLHCCHWIPLDGLDFADFVRIHHGMYQVINALMINHPATVFNIIPTFSAATSYLMKAIVCKASQDAASYSSWEVEQLVGCGHLIERLFSLLLNHKVEFARVAPYLISDYVTEVQKGTLLPQVKKALLAGIYKLLDMCDQHSISLLQMNLTSGLTEIFNTLNKDYTKYHKYTGRV